MQKLKVLKFKSFGPGPQNLNLDLLGCQAQSAKIFYYTSQEHPRSSIPPVSPVMHGSYLFIYLGPSRLGSTEQGLSLIHLCLASL